MKRIEKLTVYRDLWVRGSKDKVALLNENGMCCLGFWCLAAGADPGDVLREANPDFDVVPLLSWRSRGGSFRCTELAWDAVNINDSVCITDAQREKQLRALFATKGVKLSFRDKAPKALRAKYERGLAG